MSRLRNRQSGRGVWTALLALPWIVAAGPAPAGARAALETAIDEAYVLFKDVDEGETAQYIPALAAAEPDDFGLAVLTVDGELITRGDVDQPFAIMSAAKPFTLALLMRQQGTGVVLEKIGVEPTGLPFDTLQGIDRRDDRPLNPMVNAGAIITVSLIAATTPEARWERIRDIFDEFAGERLPLMEDVYESVSGSNYRNRAVANLLEYNKRLGADPMETLDAYNRQSCLAVTAKQLARMGAVLANGGVDPANGKRIVDTDSVEAVLSVMLTSGFYNESGRWAFDAGLPAKSGVGGGIVAIVPGEMAIVAFSPRLSAAGNSIRGTGAIRHISEALDLSVFRP